MLVLSPRAGLAGAYLGVLFDGNIPVKAVPIRLSALTTAMHVN